MIIIYLLLLFSNAPKHFVYLALIHRSGILEEDIIINNTDLSSIDSVLSLTLPEYRFPLSTSL